MDQTTRPPSTLVIKEAVDFSMLHPWVVRAMWVIAEEFAAARPGWPRPRITSGREGPHGAGSFHVALPYGLGADISRPDQFHGTSTEAELCVLRRIRKRLGPLFQLVTEADHYHLEVDERDLIATKVRWKHRDEILARRRAARAAARAGDG